MPSFSTERKITLVVFIVSILGIASEFVPFAWFSESFLKTWGFLFFLGKTVDLNLLSRGYLSSYNSELRMYTGYGNVVFHLTLLLAGIIWLVSKFRESRLIRFSFALIFLFKSIQILGGIFAPFDSSGWTGAADWLQWLIHIAVTTGWGYVAWWIITKINQSKVLDSKPGPEGSDAVYFIPTSKSLRFFHLITDTIFCALVFSNLAWVSGFSFIKEVASAMGERTALYLWFLIARLFYYIISEGLFSATPAKFLTESRVVTDSGGKPGFRFAGQRTLCRFVPFEPFSFTMPSGWHDRWTDTEVANEKRTGVPGGRYVWILVAFIVLGVGTYLGKSWYTEHQYYVRRKQSFERAVASREENLKHLSRQDFIKIKDADKSYEDGFYLKVDKVTKDSVEVVALALEDMWKITPLQLEQYFEANKEWLPRIRILRSDLSHCVTHDYDKDDRHQWDAMPLLHDGRKLTIDKIVRMYGPFLTTTGSGSSGSSTFNLEMYNSGWPGTLTEIKNIEGTVLWEVELPMRLETSHEKYDNSFYLRGGGYSPGDFYKAELTVIDTTGVTRKFMLMGKGIDREVYPVFGGQ